MKKYLITQKMTKDNHGQLTDALEITYVQFFEKLGIHLEIVSNASDKKYDCNDYAGIILTGSNDLSPEGFKDHFESNSFFPLRENKELQLLKLFLENKKKVIGLCHGMQLINFYFGGKLTSNYFQGKRSTKEKHGAVYMESPYSNEGEAMINHYHDHALFREDMGKDLVSFVFDKDFKTVEGLYHPKHSLVAIQWHPERELNYDSNELGTKILKNIIG